MCNLYPSLPMSTLSVSWVVNKYSMINVWFTVWYSVFFLCNSQCTRHHLSRTLGCLLKLTYMLLATTRNFIILATSCYMFWLYWQLSHIQYITFKTQNKMHVGLHFVLSFKYDVSNVWGSPVQPKHVACTDMTNNILWVTATHMSILMYHNSMGYTKLIRIITQRIALKQRSKIIHTWHTHFLC